MEAKNYNNIETAMQDFISNCHVFQNVLLQELDALSEMNPDRLIDCVAEKQQVVNALFEMEHRFRIEFGGQPQESVIQMFKDKLKPQSASSLQELISVVEECKRLNQVIGATVSSNMEFNRRILQALKPKTAVETYNEHGKIS